MLTSGSASTQPVARITTAATATPDRAEKIGEDVAERSLDVEAVAARTGQDETGRDVHPHADERDREHPAAEHLAGVAQPRRRLHEDPDRERDQEHAVGERGENLRALVAVRPLGRGRLGREPRGDERETERDVVREHVHRVREQGEAPRVEAADDLDGRVRRGQGECDGERAATLDARVVVVVAHAWVLPGGAGGAAATSQGSVQKAARPDPASSGHARPDPRDRRGAGDGLGRRGRRSREHLGERAAVVHERLRDVAEDQQEAVHEHRSAVERARRREERLREQEEGREAVPERDGDREVDSAHRRHSLRSPPRSL